MGESKIIIALIVSVILIILAGSFVSAGFTDWIKDKLRITGRDTAGVSINVTLGSGTAPTIVAFTSIASQTMNEAGNLNVSINFTAYDADGSANLDDSTPFTNITNGVSNRFNYTCANIVEYGTNYVNYSCLVQMWWFDIAGTWTVNLTVKDTASNTATNVTTFSLNTLTGFETVTTIGFPSINAGSTNTTANTIIVLNNTGNQNISEGGISINATNLIGETTSSQALHSGNFTASNNTVGTNECDISGATGLAQQMNTVSGANFVAVNGTLTIGNFTISDGTAQEQLYVCLWLAGNEISQQSYSTASAGAWTIQGT